MLRYCRFVTGMLIVTLVCYRAAGLEPSQVLVVANKSMPQSVELAKAYAQLRKIPQANILTVPTATSYNISRNSYDRQVAQPIRKLLSQDQRDRDIRCIVLMWGMPIRVLAPAAAVPTPNQLTYKQAADKSHYQMAVAQKLLGGVAVDFPAPRTKSFKPLGALFNSKVTVPQPPLPKVADMTDSIGQLLKDKQREVAAITNAENKLIAWRQLMALELDLYGITGLMQMAQAVSPPTCPSVEHMDKIAQAAKQRLSELEQAPEDQVNIQAKLKMVSTIGGATAAYHYAMPRGGGKTLSAKGKSLLDRTMQAEDASLDSELALVKWPDHKLGGWIRNPLYWRNAQRSRTTAPPVMLTSRIDGPSAADAMRIITDSCAVESEGLKGNFYIDAGGGPNPGYDKNLKNLHGLVKSNTSLTSVYDDKPTVFPQGSCPEAALYVGWYSLRKYVPAFSWNRGAVGWHIASFEAEQLRSPNSQRWCPKMVQQGVAATFGAVAEPLLVSFPSPQEFFGLLLTGERTIAECYWLTIPSASWRLTLIADPLYRPFAANPQLDATSLPEPLRRPVGS